MNEEKSRTYERIANAIAESIQSDEEESTTPDEGTGIVTVDLGQIPPGESIEEYFTRTFPESEGAISPVQSPVASTDSRITYPSVDTDAGLAPTGTFSNAAATYSWGNPIGWTFGTGEPGQATSSTSREDQDREITYREKAIEAACKAFGDRDVELTEFGTALDYFYNYIKFGTKLDVGK
jgi:hypothetical protein